MLISGKMQYVKNLLAINKNFFISLHRIVGMDFEKEFVILERSGKFTHNSIMKELHNLPFDGDTNDSNIYLIYADTRKYSDDKYRIAAVVDNGFDVQRDTIQGYERACGWRWINTLVSKGEFEKIRKSDKGHYFIIAQKKEFSCTKEKLLITMEDLRLLKITEEFMQLLWIKTAMTIMIIFVIRVHEDIII